MHIGHCRCRTINIPPRVNSLQLRETNACSLFRPSSVSGQTLTDQWLELIRTCNIQEVEDRAITSVNTPQSDHDMPGPGRAFTDHAYALLVRASSAPGRTRGRPIVGINLLFNVPWRAMFHVHRSDMHRSCMPYIRFTTPAACPAEHG